ncbi:MAG: chromosome partitioning protein, partial [Acidimicrobiaceae bacterium]|nr:chromosome partitioning protein [Acidimicrobiaceae bacterium]
MYVVTLLRYNVRPNVRCSVPSCERSNASSRSNVRALARCNVADMPTTKPAVSVPVVPVVAMVNQKGGVGKTTATLNLAAALAEGQRRVLVVDCDPRNVATTTLGVDTSAVPTLTDLLLDGAGHLVSEIVLPAPLWGFDVAPADAALANRELTRTTGDEFLLADAMAGIGAHHD